MKERYCNLEICMSSGRPQETIVYKTLSPLTGGLAFGKYGVNTISFPPEDSNTLRFGTLKKHIQFENQTINLGSNVEWVDVDMDYSRYSTKSGSLK